MDSLGNERRRFHRIVLEGSVQLFSGSSMWSTRLLDLSLRGILLECPPGWLDNPGRTYRINLRLDGGITISMGVRLARIENDTLGFACERIDFDSFLHLKRLVELNLGNTDMLNRELSALGSD